MDLDQPTLRYIVSRTSDLARYENRTRVWGLLRALEASLSSRGLDVILEREGFRADTDVHHRHIYLLSLDLGVPDDCRARMEYRSGGSTRGNLLLDLMEDHQHSANSGDLASGFLTQCVHELPGNIVDVLLLRLLYLGSKSNQLPQLARFFGAQMPKVRGAIKTFFEHCQETECSRLFRKEVERPRALEGEPWHQTRFGFGKGGHVRVATDARATLLASSGGD